MMTSASWSFADPRAYLERLGRGMEELPPLIVTVAITGGAQGKEANPALPESPEEQAESTRAAWNAGASVVHVHARRANNLSMTSHESTRYVEVNRLIRESCPDIVINNTMAGDLLDTPRKHCRFEWGSLNAGPEMVALDCGPVAYRFDLRDREPPLTGREQRLTVDDVFVTTYGELEALVDEMARLRIKPEFELFNAGQFTLLDDLVRRPSVEPPYWCQFVLGAQNANFPTPMDLLDLVDRLPAESMFSVIGVGQFGVPLHALSIVLGGHVRVGLEDNLYVARGRKAVSNAELVERVVRIAESVGRDVATPSEARALLGLGPPSAYGESAESTRELQSSA